MNYEISIFTLNPLCFSEFTLNSLSVSRIHYGSIFVFANSLWICYLFRYLTFNSLSISWNNYLFTIFSANSLLIHYLSNEFSIDFFSFSRSKSDLIFFRVITINSLSYPRIHSDSTFVLAYILWFHYRFRQLTLYSLIS